MHRNHHRRGDPRSRHGGSHYDHHRQYPGNQGASGDRFNPRPNPCPQPEICEALRPGQHAHYYASIVDAVSVVRITGPRQLRDIITGRQPFDPRAVNILRNQINDFVHCGWLPASMAAGPPLSGRQGLAPMMEELRRDLGGRRHHGMSGGRRGMGERQSRHGYYDADDEDTYDSNSDDEEEYEAYGDYGSEAEEEYRQVRMQALRGIRR